MGLFLARTRAARGAGAAQRADTAAADYVRQGQPLGDLNPLIAVRLGLLPKMWLTGPNTDGSLARYAIENSLALTADSRGRTVLGLRGTPGVLKEIAREYGAQAATVSLLPPMLAFSSAEQTQSLLLSAYDREQLSRAAAIERPREPTADMPSNRGRAVTSRQPRSRTMHSVIYLSWFNRKDSRDERRCVRRGARTVSHVDG